MGQTISSQILLILLCCLSCLDTFKLFDSNVDWLTSLSLYLLSFWLGTLIPAPFLVISLMFCHPISFGVSKVGIKFIWMPTSQLFSHWCCFRGAGKMKKRLLAEGRLSTQQVGRIENNVANIMLRSCHLILVRQSLDSYKPRTSSKTYEQNQISLKDRWNGNSIPWIELNGQRKNKKTLNLHWILTLCRRIVFFCCVLWLWNKWRIGGSSIGTCKVIGWGQIAKLAVWGDFWH